MNLILMFKIRKNKFKNNQYEQFKVIKNFKNKKKKKLKIEPYSKSFKIKKFQTQKKLIILEKKI